VKRSRWPSLADEFGRDAVGEALDAGVVLPTRGGFVDDPIEVRGAVLLGRVFVRSLDGASEESPDRVDGVLANRRAEGDVVVVLDAVGDVVDDFDHVLVAEALPVGDDAGDVGRELARGVCALVGDGLFEEGHVVAFVLLFRRLPGEFAAVVAVLEAVDDVLGGLLTDASELSLHEPGDGVRVRRVEHLDQRPEFDAVGVGSDLLRLGREPVGRPLVL